MYIGRIYEKILDDKNLYRMLQLPLPQPEFIVLYNGKAPYPDEAVLKLSDAFMDAAACGLIPGGLPALELTVKVYNINQGHNEAMAQNCDRLYGYRFFVAKVREYQDSGLSLDEAMQKAVIYCAEHDILKEIFEVSNLWFAASEVINMLLTEWNGSNTPALISFYLSV
jgi:hypothetical protein